MLLHIMVVKKRKCGDLSDVESIGNGDGDGDRTVEGGGDDGRGSDGERIVQGGGDCTLQGL